jgi:hypothetical protein
MVTYTTQRRTHIRTNEANYMSKPQEMRKLNFSTYNGCTNWVSGSIQAPNPEKSLAAVQQPGQLHLQ